MHPVDQKTPFDAADEIGPFALREDDWLSRVRSAETQDPLETWRGYRVLSPAIRGGQGLVYRCRRDDGTIVAVKRIHGGAEASPSARRRLQRELQLAEALHHPGIVAVRTADIDNELLIESDWIAGRTLVEWCRDDGSGNPRDARAVARAFVAVCDALDYAHQRGVIHRDLKPSNILVDGDDQPHILDFGLAGTLADFVAERTQVTLTEPLLGTPAFASPEQIAGDPERIDARSDIYSLGVLLYEALTGESPYPAGLSLGRLLRAVEDHEPTRPRAKNPDTPREIEGVTLQAMQKDARSRYQSVAELRADLDRFLQGSPTHARPPGLWFDVRAIARRHPKAAWSLASATAIVAAGVAVGGVYAFRLSQANHATAMAHSAAERVNLLLGNLIGELAPPIDDGGAAMVAQLDRTSGWLDAELSGEPWALARAHVMMGVLYAKAQRWSDADRHMTRALGDYRTLGDPDRSAVAEALRLLGLARAYQGLPDAVDRQREALAIAERSSKPGNREVADYRAALAETLVALRGTAAKSEADVLMDDALTLLRGEGKRFPAWEAELLAAYGRAWIHAGEPANAVNHLEEASRLFEQAKMPLESCPYHRATAAMLAAALEARGDSDAAAEVRTRLDAVRDRATSNPPYTQGE